MEPITLLTLNKTTEEQRNVTLWPEYNDRDNLVLVMLLGKLDHGCKLVIDQKLINSLQQVLNEHIKM